MGRLTRQRALLAVLAALAALALFVGAALALLSDTALVPGNSFSTGTWATSSVTLYAFGDTYLKAGRPNQNQGGQLFLRVRASGNNRALIQFDPAELSNVAAGKTLGTAMLRLYIEDNGNNWGSSGRTVDVHRLITAWTELGATWNCPDDTNTANSQPDCPVQWNGGAFATSPTASVLHTNGLLGWVEWDVTADVLDMLAVPGTSFGWIIKKTNEGQAGRANYTSREGGAYGPQLVLTFLD